MVCTDWAAVHKDNNSGIWEAANLQEEEQRQQAATSLAAWLTARASALRQLQLCDFESICYVEEDTPDSKV